VWARTCRMNPAEGLSKLNNVSSASERVCDETLRKVPLLFDLVA
jgi:hypothetical protein